MKPMRRRDFITLIGGAAAGWPCTARAQQPATPLVVFLSGGEPKASAEATRGFEQGLAQVGYNFRYGQGHNLDLEFHWAWGHNDKLPELAARLAQGLNNKLPEIAAALAQRHEAVIGHNDKLREPAAGLAQRPVAVIATAGVPEALAVKGATTTIPIVFTIGGDPIAAGLVPTLDRPGGNVTGVVTSKMQVGPKQLELLHQVIPTASTVALLVNPTNPAAEPQVRDAQAAARSLGLQLHVLKASVDNEIDAAFAALPGLQAGGTRDRLRSILRQLELEDRRTGASTLRPSDLPTSGVHCRRRIDQLRAQSCRSFPTGRRLYWPHSQGREACRPTGPAVHES